MARLNLLKEPGEHQDTHQKADRLRASMNPDLCLTLESPNALKRMLSREDIHGLRDHVNDLDLLLTKSRDIILERSEISEAVSSQSAHDIEAVWAVIEEARSRHDNTGSRLKIRQWRLRIDDELNGRHYCTDGLNHFISLSRATREAMSLYRTRLHQNWHLLPNEILDPSFYSRDKGLSKPLLQDLAELSKHVNLDTGRKLLMDNIQQRKGRGRGFSNKEVLTHSDVKSAIQDAKKRKYTDSPGDHDAGPVTKARRYMVHPRSRTPKPTGTGVTGVVEESRSNENSSSPSISPQVGRSAPILETGEYESEGGEWSLGFSDSKADQFDDCKGGRHDLIGSDDSTQQISRDPAGTRCSPDATRRSSVVESDFLCSTSLIKTTPDRESAPTFHPPQMSASIRSPGNTPQPLVQQDISDPRHSPTDTPDQERMPCSNVAGAVESLGPARELSATALELILASLLVEDVHALDPLWFNVDVAKLPPRMPRLSSSIRCILLPLYHAKNQHWTIAIFNLEDVLIHHYDSISDRLRRDSEANLLALANVLVPEQSGKWRIQSKQIAQQTNTYDCGIFVVIAATYAVTGLKPPSTHDCAQWRVVSKALTGYIDIYTDIRNVHLDGDEAASPTSSSQRSCPDSGSDSFSAKHSLEAVSRTNLALQAVEGSLEKLQKARQKLEAATEIATVTGALSRKSAKTHQTTDAELTTLRSESDRYEKWVAELNDMAFYRDEGLMASLRQKLEVGRQKLKQLGTRLEKLRYQRNRTEAAAAIAEQLSRRYRDALAQQKEEVQAGRAWVRQLRLHHQNVLKAIDATEAGAARELGDMAAEEVHKGKGKGEGDDDNKNDNNDDNDRNEDENGDPSS